MKFGKFEVLEETGHGAMGTIYKARDPGIGRLVAIKALSERDTENEEQRKEFLREGRIAGQLSHENIVKVYDLGEESGRPYIALEFLEGTDLRTIIQNRMELLAEKKLQIILQVARGLAFAHHRGVIHRDIKPENIRLLQDGVVKILDFGVAMRTTDPSGGPMKGTIAYMSPEQLRGKPATPRSDLFALGIVTYQLFTFAHPFPAENYAALMNRICNGKPDPIAKTRSLVHPKLQAIILQLLERNPKKRFQSADDLVAEIEDFIADHASRRKKAQKAFFAALKEYRAGKMKEAVSLWEETLRLEPDHVPARTHLKLARTKLESKKEVKLLSKLASFYLEREDNDRAVRYFQEVLRVDPHHTVAQEAVRMLGGLGELGPDPTPESGRLVLSGRIHHGMPIPPASSHPNLRRAVQLIRDDRSAEALPILRDLVLKNPKDEMARDYLLRLLQRVRKRVFEEKSKLQGYIEKGNACFKTQNFSEAEEAWNKVLSMDSDNLVARRNLEVLSNYVSGSGLNRDILYPEGQRFHQRLPAGFPARYRGILAPESSMRKAELHRLSISGISILTKAPVPISAVLEITFNLPGQETEMTAIAQVVHAVNEPFGGYLVGGALLLVPAAYVEFLKNRGD